MNTANTEDRGTPLTTRLEAEFVLMDAGADMHRLTFLRLYATSIISEPVRKARTLPLYSASLRNLVLPSAN